MFIMIGGRMIPECQWHRYAIRFALENGQAIPALYQDGKRVASKEVTLDLRTVIPADPAEARGGSTNSV